MSDKGVIFNLFLIPLKDLLSLTLKSKEHNLNESAHKTFDDGLIGTFFIWLNTYIRGPPLIKLKII